MADEVVTGAATGAVIVVTAMPVTFPFTFAFCFLLVVPRAIRVDRTVAPLNEVTVRVASVAQTIFTFAGPRDGTTDPDWGATDPH
jgi:hypothetical protein